jgi:imidazolonepropionase-like amidohydrolase
LKVRGLGWAAVALLALPAVGAAQAPLEILHGFTLIDGLGGPPLEDAALAVRGDQIVDVGTRAELLSSGAAAGGAITIDLGGGYVIPGLIDAHVHLATVPNRRAAEAELKRLLYSGVTAVRDMAGDARALASLARDARLGEIEGPDIYYSALVAGPSFFTDPKPQASTAGEQAGAVPWMQAITSETDLVVAIARAAGTSATGLKIYANLEPAEITRITEEAHRQGMPVWAHSMVFPARPLEVVRSGVDVISHVCRLAWEAMADAPDEYHHDRLPEYAAFTVEAPIFTELFTEMRQRGTILDATLSMYAREDRLRLNDPENAPALGCNTDFARQLVRRAHAAGVPISAGTDFALDPDAPFPALYQELEELVTYGGLTPMEAIESATRIAAQAIGIEDSHGTLQPGTVATLVLLDANPSTDITNLRSVREVWKNAERFRRSGYSPPW